MIFQYVIYCQALFFVNFLLDQPVQACNLVLQPHDLFRFETFSLGDFTITGTLPHKRFYLQKEKGILGVYGAFLSETDLQSGYLFHPDQLRMNSMGDLVASGELLSLTLRATSRILRFMPYRRLRCRYCSSMEKVASDFLCHSDENYLPSRKPHRLPSNLSSALGNAA
jgi:hypothetical protein